jgi:phosphoribosylformylglycinamidine synthase PurS subunit
MPIFRCEVYIRPRRDILDPQGDAVERALENLGFAGTKQVRVGRYLTLELEAPGEAQARAQLDEMCGKLLANPITEDYELKVSTA